MNSRRVLWVLAIFLMAGSINSEEALASSYPRAIAYHDFIYWISEVEIGTDDIGEEIGKIERQRAPMPQKNGESNDTPVGSLLFHIKGDDNQDKIAVKIRDTFYYASKHAPLQDTSKEQTWMVPLLVICLIIYIIIIMVWRRSESET